MTVSLVHLKLRRSVKLSLLIGIFPVICSMILNVSLIAQAPASRVDDYIPPPPPVGGTVITTNRMAVLGPWIMAIAAVAFMVAIVSLKGKTLTNS